MPRPQTPAEEHLPLPTLQVRPGGLKQCPQGPTAPKWRPGFKPWACPLRESGAGSSCVASHFLLRGRPVTMTPFSQRRRLRLRGRLDPQEPPFPSPHAPSTASTAAASSPSSSVLLGTKAGLCAPSEESILNRHHPGAMGLGGCSVCLPVPYPPSITHLTATPLRNSRSRGQRWACTHVHTYM